jgi:hypothetical protein
MSVPSVKSEISNVSQLLLYLIHFLFPVCLVRAF